MIGKAAVGTGVDKEGRLVVVSMRCYEDKVILVLNYASLGSGAREVQELSFGLTERGFFDMMKTQVTLFERCYCAAPDPDWQELG